MNTFIPFRLGAWRVEPAANRIVADDDVRTLEPKVMALLTCLAGHGPEPVTREHLIEEVWGGVHVVPGAVTRAAYQLRCALQRDEDRIYIETVRGRGYRLAVAVRPVEPESAPAPRPLSVSGWTARAAMALLLPAILIGAALSGLVPRPEAGWTQGPDPVREHALALHAGAPPALSAVKQVSHEVEAAFEALETGYAELSAAEALAPPNPVPAPPAPTPPPRIGALPD